jgi:hypothetical protein
LDDKKAEVVEDKVAPTQAADFATTLGADGSEPPVGYETKGFLWINNPTTHLDVNDANVKPETDGTKIDSIQAAAPNSMSMPE